MGSNTVILGPNMGHNGGNTGSNVGLNMVQTVSTIDFNAAHSSSFNAPHYDPSFPLEELGGEIGEIGVDIGGGIGLGIVGDMGALGGEIFSAEEDHDFSGFTSIWQEEDAPSTGWSKPLSEGLSPEPLQPLSLPHASLSAPLSYHPSLTHSLSNSHLSTANSHHNTNYLAPNSGLPHSNSEPFLAGNHVLSSSGPVFPSSFPPLFCSVIADGVVGGEKRKYVTDERQETLMGGSMSSGTSPLNSSKSLPSFFPASHPSHLSSHPSLYPSSSFTPAFPTILPTSTSTPLLHSTSFVAPTSLHPAAALAPSFPSSSSSSRLENSSEGGGTLDPVRNQEQVLQMNNKVASYAPNKGIPHPTAQPSLPSHPSHPVMSGSSSGGMGGGSGAPGSVGVCGPPPQGPQPSQPLGQGPQVPQGVQGDSDDEEAGTLGADSMGQDFISLRKRRKLNSIVPNPRKPRTADYMCAMCAEVRNDRIAFPCLNCFYQLSIFIVTYRLHSCWLLLSSSVLHYLLLSLTFLLLSLYSLFPLSFPSPRSDLTFFDP